MHITSKTRLILPKTQKIPTNACNIRPPKNNKNKCFASAVTCFCVPPNARESETHWVVAVCRPHRFLDPLSSTITQSKSYPPFPRSSRPQPWRPAKRDQLSMQATSNNGLCQALYSSLSIEWECSHKP